MAAQTLERPATSAAIKAVAAGTDLIELYYDRGWSDGLPVVPPTQEKIDAIVAILGGVDFHPVLQARASAADDFHAQPDAFALVGDQLLDLLGSALGK